jgi:hypothetical protein
LWINDPFSFAFHPQPDEWDAVRQRNIREDSSFLHTSFWLQHNNKGDEYIKLKAVAIPGNDLTLGEIFLHASF